MRTANAAEVFNQQDKNPQTVFHILMKLLKITGEINLKYLF